MLGKALGVVAVLVAIGIMLWPVHERVLGTDISCGSTWSALSVTTSARDGLDQSIVDQCHTDADARTAVAFVVGIGGVLAAVWIGAVQRRTAEGEQRTALPRSARILMVVAVVLLVMVLAVVH
jgi:uncharacterized membrane protein YidH (DUF202 family)